MVLVQPRMMPLIGMPRRRGPQTYRNATALGLSAAIAGVARIPRVRRSPCGCVSALGFRGLWGRRSPLAPYWMMPQPTGKLQLMRSPSHMEPPRPLNPPKPKSTQIWPESASVGRVRRTPGQIGPPPWSRNGCNWPKMCRISASGATVRPLFGSCSAFVGQLRSSPESPRGSFSGRVVGRVFRSPGGDRIRRRGAVATDQPPLEKCDRLHLSRRRGA